MQKILIFILVPILAFLIHAETQAGDDQSGFFGGEWYFSWGYNRDYWAPSDIHVSQPSLGNDFTVHNVKGEDYPQWNEGGLIFDKDITVPQFDFRIGHFISKEHDLALEFSVDHTKYTSIADQIAHVTGTINGAPTDANMQLTPDYFRYNLHNGANHIMLNLVKRFSLLGQLNRTFNLSVLAKGGFGIMLPHSENTIMGNNNDVGAKSWNNIVGINSGWWRLNGWTAGTELAVRFIILRPIYLEVSDKVAFASLSNIPVYQGTADQKLWMNELAFNLGIVINPHLEGP